MKRIIYFVLAILVCGIYVGCSENEIDLYDQTPRINFYGSTTHVRTLVDTDYVLLKLLLYLWIYAILNFLVL